MTFSRHTAQAFYNPFCIGQQLFFGGTIFSEL